MNKIVGNKNAVILGLQQENARLQSELHDAVQAELATRENSNVNASIALALQDKLKEVQLAAAEAQRDMMARPHRATVERCQEARRDADRRLIEERVENREVRRVQAETIRRMRAENNWYCLGLVVLTMLCAYSALA